MLCGVLSTQGALASDPLVMDFATFIKTVRAQAEQASPPQVHASSSSLPSTPSSQSAPGGTSFPFDFYMGPGTDESDPLIMRSLSGIPILNADLLQQLQQNGYVVHTPPPLPDPTASAPWPQEVDAVLKLMINGPSLHLYQPNWRFFDEHGIDIPITDKIGWILLLQKDFPPLSFDILESFHPVIDGKRTPLLTFPVVPLTHMDIHNTYTPYVSYADISFTDIEKILPRIVHRVWTRFPELCTLDFLHSISDPSHRRCLFLENPHHEAAVFNLFKALQEKDKDLLNPVLAGFLIRRLDTPEECQDFLSYMEGKPLHENTGTSSSSPYVCWGANNNKPQDIYTFCKTLLELRAVYPRDLALDNYTIMWTAQNKEIFSDFATTVGKIHQLFPNALEKVCVTFLCANPSKGKIQALENLQAHFGPLPDHAVRSILTKRDFLGEPIKFSNKLIEAKKNLPHLDIFDVYDFLGNTQTALGLLDDESAQTAIQMYGRLQPHILKTHADFIIFNTLIWNTVGHSTPGPFVTSSTTTRASLDKNLPDKVISVLRPCDQISMMDMVALIKCVRDKDEASISQTAALLNAMGVVSIVASLEDFKSLVSASEAVQVSGVLHTLATQILPTDMTPTDKYKALGCLMNDPDSGLSLVTPETAPRFLAHMRQIVPLYDPHTSGPFASFASLHLDRLSVDMNDIQSVLGRMLALQTRLNTETDWHEAEKLRVKLAPLTARYEELLSQASASSLPSTTAFS